MKRSEIIKLMDEFLVQRLEREGWHCTEVTDELLKKLEEAGMQPPKVKASIVKGNNFPFGAGCSMRCNCEDCNPDFEMSVWK